MRKINFDLVKSKFISSSQI